MHRGWNWRLNDRYCRKWVSQNTCRGEKVSVARSAVTEIGDYAVVYFLGEFEGIFKNA
jgi:hypothetical protein